MKVFAFASIWKIQANLSMKISIIFLVMKQFQQSSSVIYSNMKKKILSINLVLCITQLICGQELIFDKNVSNSEIFKAGYLFNLKFHKNTNSNNVQYYSIEMIQPDFRETILNYIKFGAIPLYKPNDTTLTPPFFPSVSSQKIELKKYLPLIGESHLTRDLENGTLLHTVEIIDPKDKIDAVDFFEDWIWDKQTWVFTKNIKAYCPIYKSYDSLNRISRYRVFYIKDSCYHNPAYSDSTNRSLIAKVSYEVYFNKEFSQSESIVDTVKIYPFINTTGEYQLNPRKFLEYLFIAAFKGNWLVSDFYNTKTLSNKQIAENLNLTSADIRLKDLPEGYKLSDKVLKMIGQNYINSIYFIEEWYINETNLMISKKVIGIAPVMTKIQNQNSNNANYIPFIVYFKHA